jgi:hypothetical protein
MTARPARLTLAPTSFRSEIFEMFARFLATLMLALVAAFATVVAAPGQGGTAAAGLACSHAS